MYQPLPPVPGHRAVGMPNPFRTFTNFLYPKSIKDVFIWGQYLWERVARYRTSVKKVISYFLSDITVTQAEAGTPVDTDAVNGFKDVLMDKYDILLLVQQFGEELAAMGNAFVSCERAFSRELLCPNDDCGWQMHLKNLKRGRDYEWDGAHFTGTCPKCHRKVTWNVKDVKSQNADGTRVRFVFRSAEDMRVQYNRLTGTYKYLYKLPEDVVTAIRRGDTVYLEDSPRVFLDAAATGERYIEFPEDQFFAMRTRTLSSLDKLYKGWGVPIFMMAFGNIVRMQHLEKFNEAVCMDYLNPVRILAPQPANLRAGIDDPNRMPMSGAGFARNMSYALNSTRNNPAQWIISPVPTDYIRVGGDKDVIPTDLLEYETQQFLADCGIPQEFRQTTLQQVAPTMGLRFFERQWIHLAKSLDTVTRWMSERIAQAHQFEDMVCKLDMTSFVEDDMNKQVQLNLMQSQIIARTNVLKRLGIDFEDDAKLKIKEQQMEADAAMEQQTDQQNSEMTRSVMPLSATPGIGQAQMNIQMMQQQAQQMMSGEAPQEGAAPAAPAAPAGPGGQPMPFNTQASQSAGVEQMFQQAQELAQQIYNMPPQQRRSQLVQLKAGNPTLHAQVMQMLRDMEQQVASQAVAQSKQPQ